MLTNETSIVSIAAVNRKEIYEGYREQIIEKIRTRFVESFGDEPGPMMTMIVDACAFVLADEIAKLKLAKNFPNESGYISELDV